MIWEMTLLTFKQFLESSDPLLTTQVEMFFRQELDLPKEEAKEAALWMEDETLWLDLEGDTRDHVLDYVEEHIYKNIYDMSPGLVSQYVYDELRKLMKQKYDISLSTPFMKKHGL